MSELGNLSIALAALVSAYGLVAALLGAGLRRADLQQSARNAVYAVFLLLSVASGILLYQALTRDFGNAYVASYSSRDLGFWYTVSVWWAGQAGSLLFWAWLLAGFGAVVVWRQAGYRELMPYIIATVMGVSVFFTLLLAVVSSPFARLAFAPPDGQGLNPLLQNPGMFFHPPTKYLGYVGFTIPFAFAIAAMASKRLDDEWIRATRRWTLASWFFLTLGVLFGMQWAYVELGWGGYWAWDPVENASLLPWLTMTAFLHSVMIQEKRGMLKRWNVGLIIASFLLSIFGTFITRSGVIASVHSFTQSGVGYFFLGFLLLAGIFSFALLYARWPLLEPEARLESLASREAAFLFNNLALVGIAFSVLWGTLFPILSEAVRGTKITVGPPFFNRVNVPLGLFLVLLTGIGPLIAWRKASPENLRRQFLAPVSTGIAVTLVLLGLGIRDLYPLMAWGLAGFVTGTVVQEFWRGTRARRRIHGEPVPVALGRLVARNRRRYGGYIVHVGFLVYVIAFAGMAFKVSQEVTLLPGESAEGRSPYGPT